MEGNARHLDSAYKSACYAFLTAHKRDMLSHATELEPLLGLRHDRERFYAFVVEALQASPPSA